MTYRSPRRWLAPLALAGAAVAIVAVVQHAHLGGGGGGGTTSGTSTTRSSTSTSTTGARTTTTAVKKARTYTVVPGDVLSSIAQKAGVSLARIEELNPSVHAQSLHAGQKIKLAP